MPKFKLKKVFNCQDMPEDIKDMFFERNSDPSHGNDCYVDWYIKGTKEEYMSPEEKAIDAWLIANGANDAPSENDSGEEVIISHWW